MDQLDRSARWTSSLLYFKAASESYEGLVLFSVVPFDLKIIQYFSQYQSAQNKSPLIGNAAALCQLSLKKFFMMLHYNL